MGFGAITARAGSVFTTLKAQHKLLGQLLANYPRATGASVLIVMTAQ
jgi:hypothetical protein